MTSVPFRVLAVSLVAVTIAACANRQSVAAAAQPISPEPTSLAGLLQGRVSGVDVMVIPNGGISVRISGPRSFRLSQEPLYVVDDVVVPPGPNGTLSWLNIEDIASIAVLRYDADAAIYGVRGSNGVIRIKTKGAH